MESRHRIMRGTVGVIINKAIRDIRSDPKRSIRNLADLGDSFSTSAAQKHFFSLVRNILKNPDNPYNELLTNLIENVNPEAIRAMSLNFGYTALNYGADTLRQQEAALGRYIPWLLLFDFSGETPVVLDFDRMSLLISNAVSLGIFTFVFKIDHSQQALAEVIDLCKAHAECSFFAAVSADVLLEPIGRKVIQTPNLVVSVDMTDCTAEKTADKALQLLHTAKCFYGFHVYYTEENAERLMSDAFTQHMIENGCLIGGYINEDAGKKSLEDRVYRYVCAKRGKKGEPLFALDFYRDIGYVGNTISSGEFLHIDGSGKVDGFAVNLNEVTLQELIRM